MSMFNPPHAGMLIKDVIETKGISAIDAQLLLDIQNAHSLWRTKNTINFPEKNLEP